MKEASTDSHFTTKDDLGLWRTKPIEWVKLKFLQRTEWLTIYASLCNTDHLAPLGNMNEWVSESCSVVLTCCDSMNYPVHGILQARILEWLDFPISKGSSQPRDWTQISHIAGRFFSSWVTRETLRKHGTMSIYIQMKEATYGILTNVPGCDWSPFSITSCRPHHCTN